MSTTSEFAELHDLIGGLRRCVTSLRSRYGDNPAMRRIVLDAERIFADVELLDFDATERAGPGQRPRTAFGREDLHSRHPVRQRLLARRR